MRAPVRDDVDGDKAGFDSASCAIGLLGGGACAAETIVEEHQDAGEDGEEDTKAHDDTIADTLSAQAQDITKVATSSCGEWGWMWSCKIGGGGMERSTTITRNVYIRT